MKFDKNVAIQKARDEAAEKVQRAEEKALAIETLPEAVLASLALVIAIISHWQ